MLPRVHIVNSSQGSFLTFGNDLISRNIFARGGWENWVLSISGQYLRDFSEPVVVDLGANLGAFSVPTASRISEKNGHVYSFEPQKTVYYQLCGNIFLNRLSNVTAFNKGVGKESGHLELPIPDYNKTDNVGSFSLVEKYRSHAGVQSTMSTEKDVVQMVKLDDMLFEGKTRFLKIDVEGLELDVLKGAVGFVEQNTFPPFSFEAWNAPWFKEQRTELLTFIQQLGYKIEHINADAYMAHHPRNEARVDFIRDNSGKLANVIRAG